MFKHLSLMLSILAVFLTACAGQQGTPTMSSADVQNTAISSAYTMVAATQMSLPTATLVPPPTETPIPPPSPLPTFTPELSLPTLQPPLIQLSPTAAFSSGGLSECNRLLNVGEAGPTFPVRIQNQTGGEALLSLYLNKNTFSQCGYMPEVTVRGSSTIYLPTGDWSFYALINYGKGQSGKDFGNFTVRPGGAADTVKIIKR